MTDKVLAQLRIQGWEVLREDLEASILEEVQKAGYASLRQVGVGTEDALLAVNERALEYARTRSADLVGMKWVNGELVENPNPKFAISENTREMLRGDIAGAFRDGLNRDQLEDELEDNYGFSEARAHAIAQTELNGSASRGNMAGWKESGAVTGKGSLLSADHPKPDECDENEDAGIIPLDQPFPSGDQTSPYHVGCFCANFAEVDAEEFGGFPDSEA